MLDLIIKNGQCYIDGELKNVDVAIKDGKIQHIGWAYERPNGKGRGFGTTGAHYHHTWADDNWRTLILNAIAWTAGVEVPKKGVPSLPVLIK